MVVIFVHCLFLYAFITGGYIHNMNIPHSLQLTCDSEKENTPLFQTEHWITVPEAAALTNRSSWLIKQIEKGNLSGIISETDPVDADGNMNYVVLLEDLSFAAQKKYFISHLPAVITVGEPFHSLPKMVVTDCGRDYKSALLEDIPDEYRTLIESQEEVCLNRRFSGLGILRALQVSVSHCLPFHPQSKPMSIQS